jgi:hypothetical protein
MKKRKIYVNTAKAVLITAIVAGLALSVAAQLTEHPGEKVDPKSLPAGGKFLKKHTELRR